MNNPINPMIQKFDNWLTAVSERKYTLLDSTWIWLGAPAVIVL